jgi:hypothetical protein
MPAAADPTRRIRVITTRLVLLLVIFYAFLFITIAVLVAPYTPAKPLVLQVFDASCPSFRMGHFSGVMATCAYMVTSLVVAPAVWKIAKRSAQCADYAVSVYVVHFLLTWYIDGFPKDGEFFGVLVLSGICSSVVAERLAMREEMAEIPLDRFVAGKTGVGGGQPARDVRIVEMV